MRAEGGEPPVFAHSDTLPSGRGAAGLRETEPRSRAGKVPTNAGSWRDQAGRGGARVSMAQAGVRERGRTMRLY